MALTTFEYAILDKAIPTQSLGEGATLKVFLRRLVEHDKDSMMQDGNLSEKEFRQLQTETANNVFQYLRDHEFIGEREGQVYFLTEKGKQLRRQGSLDKYIAWREAQSVVLQDELSRTMDKGYLVERQVEHKKEIKEIKKKNYTSYVIAGVVVIAVLLTLHFYFKLF